MTQDGGTGGGTVHGEIDLCRESQGWTTACNSMPERDGKDQEEDSPKQAARAGSLVIVDKPQVAGTCILRAFGVQMSCCLSGVVTFVLFCFVFVILPSLEPRPFVQTFSDMHAPRQPHAVTQQLSASFFVSVSSFFLFRRRFLLVWRVRRTFSPFGWCLKKNLNTSRPFEHPPVRGKKCQNV